MSQLTTAELAARTGRSRPRVLAWITDEGLPASKVPDHRSAGFRYLVDEADYEAWAAARPSRRHQHTPGTLTSAEVAERLGVAPTTVHGWIRGGDLPATKTAGPAPAGRWAITIADLDAWAESRRVQPRRAPRPRRHADRTVSADSAAARAPRPGQARIA